MSENPAAAMPIAGTRAQRCGWLVHRADKAASIAHPAAKASSAEPEITSSAAPPKTPSVSTSAPTKPVATEPPTTRHIGSGRAVAASLVLCGGWTVVMVGAPRFDRSPTGGVFAD